MGTAFLRYLTGQNQDTAEDKEASDQAPTQRGSYQSDLLSAGRNKVGEAAGWAAGLASWATGGDAGAKETEEASASGGGGPAAAGFKGLQGALNEPELNLEVVVTLVGGLSPYDRRQLLGTPAMMSRLDAALPGAQAEQMKQALARPPKDKNVYVIKKGDTLGKLAKRATGDPLEYKRLMKFNHLATHEMKVGDWLVVPKDWDTSALEMNELKPKAERPAAEGGTPANQKGAEDGTWYDTGAALLKTARDAGWNTSGGKLVDKVGEKAGVWGGEETEEEAPAAAAGKTDYFEQREQAPEGKGEGYRRRGGDEWLDAAGKSVGSAEEAEWVEHEVDPLDIVKGKVGKLDYVNSVYGKGENKRSLSNAGGKNEVTKLTTGADDIEAASCSPLMYWALKAAGYDIHGDTGSKTKESYTVGKGKKWERQSNDIKAIDMLNTHGSMLTGENAMDLYREGALEGDAAQDLTGNLDNVDSRLKGAAGAFEEMDWGYEVVLDDAKPRDFCQTRHYASGGLSGHATMIHRAHGVGAAWFTANKDPTYPTLREVTDKAELDSLVAQGFLSADGKEIIKAPKEGLYIKNAHFTMDEFTLPQFIGTHKVKTTERLGCHSSGGNEGLGGVYTKEEKGWVHNAEMGKKFERTYVGRLDASGWAKWTPNDGKSVLAAAQTEDKEGADEGSGWLSGWL